MEITIGFTKDDTEFREVITEYFGNDVRFIETNGFDGFDIVFVAIIPAVALTAQLVDFFIQHIANRTKKVKQGDHVKESNDVNEAAKIKRCLITPQKLVFMENYERDDIIAVLQNCFNNNEHE